MKRQDSSLRSASSRGENATENLHGKTTGCMSGIAHLLSKYHSSRKFLTFGRKQEKNGAGSSSRISKSSTAIQASTPPILGQVKNGDKSIYLRRFLCNVPRSPTLPAEIRRSNSVDPPESSPIPPTLVARLMGLEQALAPQVTPKTAVPEPTSTNKRQQLLGALEKCDEDLKALKKIIDAVRAGEGLRSPALMKRMETIGDKKKRFYGANSKCLEFGTEHPSPVSVLDESTRSPFSNHQHYKKQVLNYGCGFHDHFVWTRICLKILTPPNKKRICLKLRLERRTCTARGDSLVEDIMHYVMMYNLCVHPYAYS
ncbi:hypothetical protein PRUPE_7G023900 [Prunus persica]|uniref:DUF3741 domain-containing protein n=1 Tax=Prunus persica TaxID=3760 RepID=A0A251N5K2_PRUPE|nr:uncharacterized protein LOC18769881 isoform X2 [Prunus persica]ONH94627.1 hypothetical protein PRUPE_7G023900 [Prunus persica]ONH94628.1 hypothetical protein PRUPE_7G023900 [Prunus persica]